MGWERGGGGIVFSENITSSLWDERYNTGLDKQKLSV